MEPIKPVTNIMITTSKTETTVNVKTIEEAKQMVLAAIEAPNLKSLGLFVWSDKDSGIEVRISYDSTTVS
jgi:hypothetical protein